MIVVVDDKITTGYSTKWYSVEYINGSHAARLFALNRQGIPVKCVDILMLNCHLGSDSYFTRYNK